MKRIFLIAIIGVYMAFSQEVEVQGGFLADTIQLGQKVSYSLSVKFPYELQLLMPDSTANFGNFKLLSKRAFNSKLKNNIQTDSVVYELISFKLDSIQYLSMPVHGFSGADSTVYYAQKDSVILKKIQVQQALLSDTTLIPVNLKFNYQIWIAAILVSLLLGYFLIKFYRRKIIRVWKRTSHKRQFKKYIKTHNYLLKDFQQMHNVDILEKIVGNWKQTMSEVSQKPISTYTSREINQVYNDTKLYAALQEIDKAIYSKKFSEALYVDIEIIYNKSKQEFFKTIK